MKNRLSALMITKNCQETVEKSLRSVIGWVDEIVIVDDDSTDKTMEIVQSCNSKIKIYKNREENLGRQRELGLSKCSNDWVLVLDSDEVVSEKLKKEIATLLPQYQSVRGRHCYIAEYNGYLIPFQNHYLGRRLKYGGENYKKLVLFKKEKAIIKPGLVNEKFEITSGKVGCLKNKIYHYSYRSLGQMFKKFTDYAIRDAQDKINKGEKTSLTKILFYPLHMFWARFIKDKGYKDGLFRIPLDIGFAYMEFLTYLSMLFMKLKLKGQKSKPQVKS